MNIIDEKKYDEIKNIIEGCDNISNAKLLFDIYITHNPETKKLVKSLIDGKKFDNTYSYEDFSKIMAKITFYNNKEQCTKLISKLYSIKDTNNLQLKTLKQIVNKKFNLNENYDYNLENNNILEKKEETDYKYCPHCYEEYYGNTSTQYVVCGYSDIHNGYNWTGCQKDWCYKCGKKLCKSWNENKLYLEPNRIHDSECCKNHSKKTGDNYDNYCMCSNKYIMRHRTI